MKRALRFNEYDKNGIIGNFLLGFVIIKRSFLELIWLY